jgi:hypothetical protein
MTPPPMASKTGTFDVMGDVVGDGDEFRCLVQIISHASIIE